jgi:hypothetical protein
LPQEALYETWGAEADDWDTQEYTDDQLINVLYDVRLPRLHYVATFIVLQSPSPNGCARVSLAVPQDDKSPEALGQNVLALTLALLLCLAVGNVMWKIVAVSWALLSAAVRYSAVAFILLCIAAFIV